LSREEIDWPGIRAAAIALNSVRLAAMKASQNLSAAEQRRFVERVNKRAYRERWLDKAKVLSKPRDNGSLPLSKPVQSGADAIAATLAERKEKSALHLSRYVVDASQKLANSNGKLELARSGKDVVAMRSGIWPEHQNKTEIGLTLNLLNLTSGNAD
jgi:hypothetical protein